MANDYTFSDASICTLNPASLARVSQDLVKGIPQSGWRAGPVFPTVSSITFDTLLRWGKPALRSINFTDSKFETGTSVQA